MIDFEELKEGASLGGNYTLERSIRQDRTGAFFAALSDDGERLLIKLAPEQGPEAEQQFATWRRLRNIREPHLLEVRDVGRHELSGATYIYAVFEYPDDVLASALEQGPLSEADTRAVLEAAVPALRCLHGQGLVHGAIDPGHVVAVGEAVKLSTDELRESEDPESQAEDVRQLGELLLSLRAPKPLSAYLAAIVRHATATEPNERWTIEEIARWIDPRPTVTADPLVIPPPPVTADIPVIPPSTIGAELPMIPPPAPRSEAPGHPPRPFPKWIVAGLAILLFAILALNLRRKPDVAPVTPVSTVAPPAAIQPQILRLPSRPPSASASSSGPATWRVVAFTYLSMDMAVKKAREVNKRWPDLHATVFQPKKARGYYLVALGDRMKREDALELQRKARSLGLPKDSYVQNYYSE